MGVQFMTDDGAETLEALEAGHVSLFLQDPCARQVQSESHQGRGVCQGLYDWDPAGLDQKVSPSLGS